MGYVSFALKPWIARARPLFVNGEARVRFLSEESWPEIPDPSDAVIPSPPAQTHSAVSVLPQAWP